eukprot:Gb_16568 [translate_table: standard]
MASEEQVKTLSVWVSPFGMRMVIGLEEKGVKYDYQEEENWQNKSELLLKMNPIYKKMPVLVHNGKHVIESLIVLEYIDKAWPSSYNNFFHSNPYDRAIANFWADFTDKKAYFGGKRIGFIDIVFIPLVFWFHVVEVLGGFKIPLEDKCPSIDAWVKRCIERESVKKILPQPEKVLEFAIGFRNVRLTG